MRDATKRHEDDAHAWLLLGQTLALQGELDDAVEAFGQAVAHGTGQVAEIARDAAARTSREQQIEKDYRLDKTPYFDILGPIDTQGPQFGTRLAATLERARAQVCSDLAVYPQHRATVVLYPPDAFRAATGTHEWVGGLFDRKIRLPIADVERDADKIEAAFRHEYTHLIVSEVSPGCPTFVNEGLAQVMEYGRGTGVKRLTDWLDQRQGGRTGLPKIADLPATFLDISDPDAVALAYLVSHAFVDQLVATHGTGPVLAFVRALDSQPLDEAFQATFRRPLADQEEMFQQAVKSAR
jgi:microcompartment protein CcmK/EutM